MTHFLLLFYFLSLSVSFADNSVCSKVSPKEVLTSLRLQSFDCQTKTEGNCSYQECLGSLPSYSRPVLIIVPENVESLRLHFHGHKLGKFPEYEKTLSGMLNAFGLMSSLCQGSEVAVFPESTGNCTTYDQTLKEKSSIQTFMKEIHSALGQNLKSAPLHLSAHSGGGRALSRFLNAEISTTHVSVYDGIYSESVKNSLKNWYQASEGKLLLASIKGMSPEKYSVQLKQEIDEKLEISKATIKGTAYDISKGKRFGHYSRAAGDDSALKAHYEVLSQTWTNEP